MARTEGIDIGSGSPETVGAPCGPPTVAVGLAVRFTSSVVGGVWAGGQALHRPSGCPVEGTAITGARAGCGRGSGGRSDVKSGPVTMGTPVGTALTSTPSFKSYVVDLRQ